MSSRTVRLTAAQALVRYLAGQWSERDGQRRRAIPALFGIFGHGNVCGLGPALEEDGGRELRFLQPKNEQASVHAAIGFARSSDLLATLACTASVGPGSTNLVTGAATATVNRVPVLLLPADGFAHRRGDPVMQALEHPREADLSVNDTLRPVSSYFDRITRPEQLLRSLPEAMRVLLDPAETGAVTLSLCQDVQGEAYDFPLALFEPRTWRVSRRPPAAAELSAAVEALRAAERPLLIAGGGVHYSGALPELAEVSERLGVPVAETSAGKGALPGGALAVGGIGVTGTRAANALAREADLIVAAGSGEGSARGGERGVRVASALAIAGGEPAVPAGSHRRWPQITAADRAALARVLDSGELWGPNAPEVSALQEEWADYVGTRFALLTNSGTAALHCAAVAAGVGPGDEVIVPAFSFVATPMAVLHAGAVPVFCDIDPVLHTLDPLLVEALITERTRAIMPVHVHGLPADMDELRAVAARHRLAVIEDAAQAHGALYRGVRAGALGDGAAFSLNGSKLLSASEGGLFVTDDEEAFVAARRLAIFGEDTPPLGPGQYRAYRAHGTGWNYRAGELVAALARAQLQRLDGVVQTAQRNAEILDGGLAGLPGVEQPHVPDDRTCVYYRYRVRIDAHALGFCGSAVELRDRLLCALQAEGVAASLWQLLPLPAQPVFRRGRFASWRPGDDREPLAPWDPEAHPRAARLLESSFVIGTADEPVFCQPCALMQRYVEAFEKVIGGIETVLAADYVPVQPWPPPAER